MKLATKIKRFEKLREWVREEPRRYNQGWWATRDKHIVALQEPPCGTMACLAGGAVLMSGYRLKRRYDGAVLCASPFSPALHSIPTIAKRLLGLTEREATGLFDSSRRGWSGETSMAYGQSSNCATREEQILTRANAAIAELDIRIAAMRRELKRKGNITVPHD